MTHRLRQFSCQLYKPELKQIFKKKMNFYFLLMLNFCTANEGQAESQEGIEIFLRNKITLLRYCLMETSETVLKLQCLKFEKV